MKYAEAGVDLKKAERMHAGIAQLIASTLGKRALKLLGHYAGVIKLRDRYLALHTDGVGTKVLVAQFLERYSTIGIDCIAMNVNDIVCIGAEPIAFVDYIALEREDERLVSELIKGLVRGAREAGVAIVGGETAVMRDVIKGYRGRTGFDLAGTALGLAKELIIGDRLKPGDVIIGTASSGIHSNGLTLARKVLPLRDFAEELLTPTRIYVKQAKALFKYAKAIAHITGGAFSKLSRIGKLANVGFYLDALPEPPEIFKEIAKRSRASEREMYKTFNMGIGMCYVVDESQANKALKLARRYFDSWIIGKITRKREVRVKAKSSFSLASY